MAVVSFISQTIVLPLTLEAHAFGAKRTFSEPRLQSRIYGYAPP